MDGGKKDPALIDLWAFMLHVYAQPGVAPACLRLQEAHGVDVPLLLAVLYGGVLGKSLNLEEIRALDDRCLTWREAVIRPLRQARKAIKTHKFTDSEQRIPPLRDSIKAAELSAERVEAEVIERMLLDLPQSTTPFDLEELVRLTRLVLDLCDATRAEPQAPEAHFIPSAVYRTFAS